jgi:thiamine-monophosphate kinase
VGDTIYVTGTLGDAAAGLEMLENDRHDDYLVQRFLRPQARIDKGLELGGKANAAIDISDGLVGDLRKLLDASGVGARIDVDAIPLSPAITAQFGDDDAIRFALTGGDDYELCFTAVPDAVAEIAGITAIGVVTAGNELVCRRGDETIEVDDSGYRHFL